MGLAEKINPDKEALCIAVGKGVYVWNYEKPQKLATHKTRVSSLATKGTRLVHCDGQTGVWDTIDEKLVHDYPWWKITTDPSGELFGVLQPDFAYLLGMATQHACGHFSHYISHVPSKDVVASRKGIVELLVGKPFLMDAGNYSKESALTDFPDSSIYDTLKNKMMIQGRVLGIETFQGIAPADKEDEFYVALNTEVERRKRGEVDPIAKKIMDSFLASIKQKSGIEPPKISPDPVWEKVFTLTSPVYEQYCRLSDLAHEFTNLELNDKQRETTWKEFSKVLQSIKEYVPKSFFKLKYHQRKKALELKPLLLADAEPYYAPITNAYKQARLEQDLDDMEEESHPLVPVFDVALKRLKDYCFNKHGIYSMAKLNNHLVMGLGSGELVMKNLENKQEPPYVIWHFGKPIESLLSVPMEVYDDGIKQHVIKRIQQRAHFAGKGKIYEFTGMPIPLRKTG